jgi:hypothetical protein
MERLSEKFAHLCRIAGGPCSERNWWSNSTFKPENPDADREKQKESQH